MKCARLFLACAAAGLALSAQAVTMQWQTGAENSIYTDKYFATSGSTSTKTLSFAMVVTANATAASTGQAAIADLGLWDAGHAYAYMYGSGNALNGHIGVEKKGGSKTGWGNTSNTPSLSVGTKYLLTITIERNANNQATITGYANGVQLFSVTDENTSANIVVSTFASENNEWTINETAAYEGILTQEEITRMANQMTAVLPTNIPEPTALALLALGVAGVALRRRVA